MTKLIEQLHWRYAKKRITHEKIPIENLETILKEQSFLKYIKIVRKLIVPLFLLFLTGCLAQNQKNKKENYMTAEENKQVVIRFNKEFFELGNTEIVKELLTETFTNHTAPPNAPKDATVMIQFIAGFHKGFTNISVQIDEVLAEDDKVSLRKTITATHSGEFMGKKATGKKVEMSVIEIDILKEGKITDHWSRNDFMQVVQGL